MAAHLDWAQATGRILPSSRAKWEANWQRDPGTTEACVRILARVAQFASVPGASPVHASGPSYASSQTASGLDVSALPPRLRKVAAGCGDRETVMRLLDTYGGETLEPDLSILQLQGFGDDVINGMQAALSEERGAELDAFNRSVEAANDAYQRQLAEEHQRRRQGLQ